MRSSSANLTLDSETKLVNLHVYEPGEYDAARAKHKVVAGYDDPNTKVDDVFAPRGFESDDGSTEGYDIHVVEVDIDLIAHEIGHVFGIHHPDVEGASWRDPVRWKTLAVAVLDAASKGFPISAFSGLLRWHDPEGLRPLARELIASVQGKSQGR